MSDATVCPVCKEMILVIEREFSRKSYKIYLCGCQGVIFTKAVENRGQLLKKLSRDKMAVGK